MLCADSLGMWHTLSQAEEKRKVQMGKVGGLQTCECSCGYGGKMRKLQRIKTKRAEMKL